MDVSMRGRNRSPGAAALRPSVVAVEHQGRLLELECRETLDDLEALQEVWQALERRCPEPFTYFQSFDWCRSWCRTFLSGEAGDRIRPRVYVLWEGAECVMIWPLMTRRLSPAITILTPLTAPMNQYSTLLHDPARFDLALGHAVFAEIRRDGAEDALCLDYVPQSAMLARLVEGRGSVPQELRQSSILDLTGIRDWDEHHAGLPKKQRQQRNSRRNRLEKLGALDYRVYPAGSRGYAEHLDRCIALKQEWLKSTGRLGRDLFDPRFAHFLRDLGRVPGQQEGSVFLHALSLDGKPIAIELGMRFREDYYSFIGAIDLDYQKFSPGKVQMEYAQRWAIETGIRRFDFLNDPSTYKSSWTNTTEPLTTSYVPFTSLGRIYCRHWMTGLRPRLRAVFHGIGPAWRNRVRGVIDAAQRLAGRSGGSMSLVLCCIP